MAIVHLDEKNFRGELANSETPVVIDFFAEWCGPCKMLGPVFEELDSEFEGKMKFVKVDIDESPEIAERFNVRGVPTLVILRGDQEVDRIVGLLPKEVLKEKLEEFIQR